MQHTAARMQEFRKSMRPLMFFSSGSLLNAEFLALTDISESRQVRPGDYLHFPGLKSLACVVELRSKGVAACLFFDPSLACKCGAERCWRLRLPIQECEVEIPSGCKFGRALTSAFGQLTSRVVCPWSVCYHETVAEVEPTLSRDRVDLVRSILEATKQDFSGAFSAFTPRVVGMYNAATTQAVVLQASDGTEVLPMCCSASTMAGECDIAPRGWQNGVRSISAMGVHRLRKRRYRCHMHGVEWAIADLPGDRVGSFQIRGEYWPGAIWLFEETECFEALRRALEQATQDSVVSTLATHPSRAALTPLEMRVLSAAVAGHADSVPRTQTIAGWIVAYLEQMNHPDAFILAYLEQMNHPDAFILATCLLRTHGAVLNMDFSASDVKQLLRKGDSTSQCYRGITGLYDPPPHAYFSVCR